MSITFTVEGERSDPERPETYLNVHNANGVALLAWLDLPTDQGGSAPAREVAARCRRRLWPEARNEDRGEAGYEAGRVISGGRAPGTLNDRTEKLLKLCERAGSKHITWG